MGGNTIRKEWFDFWDFSPDMASVPAFCQQRQKLLPETMDFLFHSFNDSFSSLETYRGFRLLACDKSDLAIAYTPDDKDTYRRHNSEYSCAVTPQVRQTGNRLSGLAGTAYASLLT